MSAKNKKSWRQQAMCLSPGEVRVRVPLRAQLKFRFFYALTIPFLHTNSHFFCANSHFKNMMRSCFLYEGIMPKSWIICKEVVQICNLRILLDIWWAMNVSMLFWAKLDFLATVTSHQWLFVRQAEKATLLLPHLETVGSKLKRRTTLETLGTNL